MQLYIVYLYVETALHVSGGTSTHHQEHIQLYLQHLVFVTPLTATCRCRGGVLYLETALHVSGGTFTHHQRSSNSSTIAAGSSNGVANTRCCRYSCMRC